MSESETVENARTLLAHRVVPAFAEIFERGKGDIVQFARDFCDTELHEGQVSWVHTAPWASERILACGNRWGKSKASSVKLRHHILYQTRLPQYAHLTQEYNAFALSITIDMAKIVFDDAFYGGMENDLYRRFIVEKECKQQPFPRMVVGEGSLGEHHIWRSTLEARSTSKNARYLLGKKMDYVAWDEPAREPNGRQIRGDVLLMRMADRAGRIDYTSTGNGMNWYYHLYQQALRNRKTGRFYAQTGPVFENPHVSHDHIRETEKWMSEAHRKQNIYGLFAEGGGTFSMMDIQNCYQGVEYPFPQPPQPDGKYLMAVDFARRHDKTTILVAKLEDQPPHPLVYAEALERIPWPDIFGRVAEVHRSYNNATAIGDATAMGGDIAVNILQEQYGVPMTPHSTSGTGGQKEHLILMGQEALKEGLFQWPYHPSLADLVDQLTFYSLPDTNLETDWVMSFCMLGLLYHNLTDVPVVLLDAPTVVAARLYAFDTGLLFDLDGNEIAVPFQDSTAHRIGEFAHV